MKWEQYYSKQALTEKMPEMTMYDYVLQNNKNHMDDVILRYFGKQITYKDFFV